MSSAVGSRLTLVINSSSSRTRSPLRSASVTKVSVEIVSRSRSIASHKAWGRTWRRTSRAMAGRAKFSRKKQSCGVGVVVMRVVTQDVRYTLAWGLALGEVEQLIQALLAADVAAVERGEGTGALPARSGQS